MDYAQQLAFFANILEQKRLVTRWRATPPS